MSKTGGRAVKNHNYDQSGLRLRKTKTHIEHLTEKHLRNHLGSHNETIAKVKDYEFSDKYLDGQ